MSVDMLGGLVERLAAIRRGWTPRELARMIRVSPDRVRAWIQRGELGAINVADKRSDKPRYIILPQHLDEFTRKRRVNVEPKPTKRRRRPATVIDFYPD